MAHAGGRPSKYKPIFCKKLVEFVSTASKEKPFPTIEGFAIKYKINPSTIQDWQKEFPEFTVSCNTAKAIMKERLMDGALTNNFNASFAKFVGVNLGMLSEHTKAEVQTNVTGEIKVKIDWSEKNIEK